MTLATNIIISAVAASIGLAAGHTYQKSKTDLAEYRLASLVRMLDQQAEAAREERRALKDRYDNAQKEANKKYDDSIARLNDDAERLRKQRDQARARALSASAESTGGAGKLCFTRKGFDSALRRLDEGLSALVGECGDVERRLEVTSEWWNELTTSPP